MLTLASVILFIPVVACDYTEMEEETGGTSLSALNEEVFEAIHLNDYEKVDSLSDQIIHQAEEAGDYEVLIDVVTNKAISYLDRQRIGEAKALVQENLERIEIYGTPRQKAYALVQLTNMYTSENNQTASLETIDEAISLLPIVDDKRTIASVYATKASVISQHNPVEALRLNYDALEIFVAEGDNRNEAISRNNIGLIHHRQESYENALEEFEKAMALNRSIESNTNLAINYNNISNTLSALGRKSAAADSLLKAIEINQHLGVSPRLIQNYYNLAQIYLDSEEYEGAYEIYLQAYEESKSINFLPGIMYHSTGLADVLLQMGNLNEVQVYVDESRELAERMGNFELLARGWSVESILNEQLGNYDRAFAALKEYQVYSDSLIEERRVQAFEEVHTAYEVDLQIAENEFLRQELDYQANLNRYQMLGLILLVLSATVIAVFLMIMYRGQQKLKKAYTALKQKTRLITRKSMQLEMLNRELEHLNSDKDRLVGVIVHDLRNPLFGVIGFLDVIRESVTDNSEIEHLEMAQRSAYRLNSLIDSLLDVHSLEKQNHFRPSESVQIAELIENSVSGFQLMSEKKNITIKSDIEDFQIETHPPYLARILDNLISNAVKFSPGNSKVHVGCEEKPSGFWSLSVSDEGPGFSDDDKKQLFQMFSKLSARPTDGENSTGLGLYTVNMLVGRLKGKISVHSKIGKGTRFICEFPINYEDTAAIDEEEATTDNLENA